MTKLLLLCLLMLLDSLPIESSSPNPNKIFKQSKHSKPSSKVNCSKMIKEFKNPHSIKRTFTVTPDRKNLISLGTKNSLIEIYTKQCSKTAAPRQEVNEVELEWHYEFFESIHCIRVELDLFNVTRFTRALDYTYYMFSYRELGSQNIHIERQPIVESKNALIIARANIKPYIVCVSFFKKNITMTSNDNSTNATKIDCKRFGKQLLEDQKLQNIDLCIDIMTPMHFLSMQSHEENHGLHTLFSEQLIMVIFILCLVGVVLATIATCQFIIDRPRKRRMKALKEYLAKRAHNLFQSTGSHGSLNKDKLLGSNPSMVIVPHMIQEVTSQSQFEPSEGEALLGGAHGSNDSFPPVDEYAPNGNIQTAAASTAISPAPIGKITFSVGETILEDTVGEAATSTNSSELFASAVAGKTVEKTVAVKAPSDEAVEAETKSKESADDIEGSEEAVKAASHLLNDKPWSLTRRDSKPFIVEKIPASTNLTSSGSQARLHQ